MPDRLLSLLRDVGFDVTAEELADCLWLAERMPADAPLAAAMGLLGGGARPPGAAREPGVPPPAAWAEEKESTSGPDAPGDEPAPAGLHASAAPPADGSEAEGYAGSSEAPGRDDDPAAPEPGPAQTEPAEPPEPAEPAEDRSAALPVRIPHPHALALPLRTARALRPLKQYRPHPSAEELDEAETAARIAHSGLLDVVTRPARDRWLDLTVVVDDGVSMLLWQQLCSELNSLLAHIGAFRQIRTYGLRLRPGQAPRISSRPFVPDAPTVSAEVLTDPSGRTMTLVISDGAGPGWRTGAMRAVLSRWAAHSPTAVIHTLPPRMWRGSGLPTRRWSVRAPGPGAANSTWRVRDPVLPEALSSFGTTPVPVLTPSPQSFADWARVTAGEGSGGVLALWDADTAERQRPSGVRARSHTKQPPRRVRPDAEVQRFRRAVSPEAYRLAAHLAAVSPLTIPVMRLVVHSLPRPVTTAHLAEVFLSGMLRPAEAGHGPPTADVLPQQRVFAFTSDSRDILLDAVPTTEVLASTRRVSEHIAELVGRSPDFPAWLDRPDGTSRLPDDSSAFAWLSPALQDRLGLTGLSAQEWTEQPTLPREIRLSPPGSIYPQFPLVGYSAASTTWSAVDSGSLATLGGYRLTGQAGQPGGPSLFAGSKGKEQAVIRASSTHPRSMAEVRREALAIARFDHPCLPSLLDAAFDSGTFWAAATGALNRLGQGAPALRAVAQSLRVHETFGTDLILVLGQRLASALDHSHHAGIVHGHLSADRVLLTLDGPLLIGWHRSETAAPGTAPTPGRTAGDVRALAALLGLLGSRTDWHPSGTRRYEPLLTDGEDAPEVGRALLDEISDPSLAAVLSPFLTLPTHHRAMTAESMLAAFRDRVPRDAFLQPFSWWLPASTATVIDHARLDLSSRAAPGPQVLLAARLPLGAEVPLPDGEASPAGGDVPLPGGEPTANDRPYETHEPGRRGRQLTKWFRLPGRPEQVSRHVLRRRTRAGKETVIRPFGDRPGRLAVVFGAGPGTGRSTVAVQLASALAAATPASRRPPVLMLPFAPAAHVLGYRMVADEDTAYGRGLPDHRVSAMLSPADIRLSPTGVWVTLKDSNRADFVHQHAPAGQPPPSAREHRDILARMRRMGTLVVDFSGDFAPPGPSLRGTFGEADRLVVTCSGDPDQVAETAGRLDWLAGHRHASLVSDALLVLSDLTGTAAGRSELDEAERRLGPLVGDLVRIPYEAALRDGGLVDHSALGPLTRKAFGKAARDLFG
ncbi:SAV_2336 N-terminal domain-related protein [Streptomyces sp. NBC_01012]|uniref:SAV_2336 N-terminal domain-related protein n=1 Tax=Streptomyces sp. NBC_01012 TaxID=2903717 RepID=UPI0038661409|nr:SAV_2336 family protein [Streptomyces sp. NBC_01012]